MKKILFKLGNLLLPLGELALGVLLLIDPMRFTSGIIVMIGVFLLFAGVAHVLHYFRLSPEEAAIEQCLSRGLLEVAGGLFCIMRANWFLVTFPLLTVLYGLLTLFTGAAKIQWAVDLLRIRAPKWFWAAISAAVTLTCSAVILYNPFGAAAVLWMFIALALIVEAVFDVLAAFYAREERQAPPEPSMDIVEALPLDEDEQ